MDILEILKPFIVFHNNGSVWDHTAWKDKPEDTAVLYDHSTGNKITLGDFWKIYDWWWRNKKVID